jgi:hypothetical protein
VTGEGSCQGLAGSPGADAGRPYLVADSMWGDLPSWVRLYGRTLR